MRESEEVGGEQCASKYWLELTIFWWQREAGSSLFVNLTVRWCCYLDRIFSGDLFLSCLSWIPPIRLFSLVGKATRHRDTKHIWYGPQFLRIKLPITTHVAFWSMEQAYSKKQGKEYRKKETSYSGQDCAEQWVHPLCVWNVELREWMPHLCSDNHQQCLKMSQNKQDECI